MTDWNDGKRYPWTIGASRCQLLFHQYSPRVIRSSRPLDAAKLTSPLMLHSGFKSLLDHPTVAKNSKIN